MKGANTIRLDAVVLGGVAVTRRRDPDDSTQRSQSGEQALGNVGPYRLLAELGEGGMGVVYEALQGHPLRRRVALKLIKRGMDTRKVVARFESERQALAMMNHPNIAKVLDAAESEDGRPYFVMELVRGSPLNEYCDEQKLTIRARLELFIEVCSAVQHAHQRGVIHRDLKPSNVLVTVCDGRVVPKIIDFGIAKATTQPLTSQSLLTEFGQFIGTPEYMSPEQAAVDCRDIDTRTDVYALGVVLYELLSGTTPCGSQLRTPDLTELRRRIQTNDALRPSSLVGALKDRSEVSRSRKAEPRELTRLLRGDLDWIVLKALEKDRERRYGSVAELGADVRRHLDDRPVKASPPSLRYRVSKFARRHRTYLGFALAISILGVGLAVALGFIVMQERRLLKLVAQLPPETQEVLLMGMGVKADDLARVTGMIKQLEDADRAEVQKPVEVLSALNLRPGERVADIGAGSGYFTVPIAQLVEPSGHVWAVEIEPAMLEFLGKRLKLEGIQNVRLSLVPTDDPQLPPGSVDTVLMVDTFRLIENRPQYAEKLRSALAPGGRVVIIDERPRDPPLENSGLIPRSVVDEAMALAGFTPVKSHNVLPRQYFVEYGLR